MKRIRMLLTEEEAAIINTRRQRINACNAKAKRIAKQILLAQCRFMAGKHADRQCPMNANPDPVKEGYCGQHYNKVHGLKQWAK